MFKKILITNTNIVTIEMYLSNKELYYEFYLQGWWKHYNNDFQKFKDEKIHGWTHNNSGFYARLSDSKNAIKKAQDKINKLIYTKRNT